MGEEKTYIFLTGSLKLIVHARDDDEAVKKFVEELLYGDIPAGTRISFIAEFYAISQKTGEIIEEPKYCLASPYIVAAGLMPLSEYVKHISESFNYIISENDIKLLIDILRKKLEKWGLCPTK